MELLGTLTFKGLCIQTDLEQPEEDYAMGAEKGENFRVKRVKCSNG